MLNLRQLEYFVAVAEELHFGRAARRLHVSQPTISEQVRELEHTLGVELIDRSVRPIALTRAGLRLLDDAHRHLRGIDRTVRTVARTARGEVGVLRIGHIYGGLFDLVLATVTEFRRRHPAVGLELQALEAGEQIRALRERQVDVVVARLMNHHVDDDLVMEPLADEHLIAMLPVRHPSAGADRIRLGALAEEGFAMFPRRSEPYTFDRYVDACLRAGFSPSIEHEVGDALTQALLVAAGLAVALSGSGLAVHFPHVAYVDVAPATVVTRFALLSLRDGRPALVDRFAAAARAVIDQRGGSLARGWRTLLPQDGVGPGTEAEGGEDGRQ